MEDELDESPSQLELLMEAVRRGKAEITNYEVFLDSKDSTALIVELDIRWYKPIEYIQLNFTAIRTDIKFEDIVDDSETNSG